MLTETIRQAIDKGLINSRAIIVDSTHTYSKGNPETPTQILRRLTKGLYKIEAKNAELKQAHGLARCKYTGLFGMKICSKCYTPFVYIVVDKKLD